MQGAEYLRSLNVKGETEELLQASREYGNHALALTLLGTFLADFFEADIRRRVEIRGLLAEQGKPYEHARRAIAAYDRLFAGEPEAAILRALGYFDRPAEPAALNLVLPPIEDRQYRAALKRLHRARLISASDPREDVDCHPLIREYFAAEATCEGHARLFEHYTTQSPHRPSTLEEMEPLFFAVYHGCRAGQQQTALHDIYLERILRKEEFYLLHNLGAYGTDLSLLATFFSQPWTIPTNALSPSYQSWVIGEAAFDLYALGRLADAVCPMRVAAEAYVNLKAWHMAAQGYSNLNALYLALGNVPEALAAARESVEYADRHGGAGYRVVSRTSLAATLHQAGDIAQAMHLFAEAEQIQMQYEPARPILFSIEGYRFCDILLDQGQTAEVLRRASQTQSEDAPIFDVGLSNLLLGLAQLPGSTEAALHLDQAIDFLRRAGRLTFVPLGLLARRTPHDLEDVLRIATRSGMRLYLADYHLVSARFALTDNDATRARSHFEKAEALVRETGYHRRDSDLEELRAELAG